MTLCQLRWANKAFAHPEPGNYQGGSVPEQQYGYVNDRESGLVLISLELYHTLPRGTVLRSMRGEQLRKGHGILAYTPDFRLFEGGHRVTHVGFPARQDDPPGIFTAGYRDN